MAKLTPKQENFAIAYVETGSASEAYRRAYDVGENTKPKTIWAEACRVMASPLVSARVFGLREAAQERALVTVESLTKEFDENRAKASELEQVSAMNTATTGKARLYGLDVGKVDHTSSDGSMTPTTVELVAVRPNDSGPD